MKESNGFIKGALIGGVIGGVAGLLLAPKPGNKLIKDIVDSYESVQKNGHDFIESLKETTHSMTHPFENIENNHQSLLIGGAIGAVIAALATLFLAPTSRKILSELLGNQYEEIREKAEDFVSNVNAKKEQVFDEVNDWKDTLSNLICKLSNNAKGKLKNSSNIDEIVDLAHLGIRLYKQFQNRR